MEINSTIVVKKAKAMARIQRLQQEISSLHAELQIYEAEERVESLKQCRVEAKKRDEEAAVIKAVYEKEGVASPLANPYVNIQNYQQYGPWYNAQVHSHVVCDPGHRHAIDDPAHRHVV